MDINMYAPHYQGQGKGSRHIWCRDFGSFNCSILFHLYIRFHIDHSVHLDDFFLNVHVLQIYKNQPLNRY